MNDRKIVKFLHCDDVCIFQGVVFTLHFAYERSGLTWHIGCSISKFSYIRDLKHKTYGNLKKTVKLINKVIFHVFVKTTIKFRQIAHCSLRLTKWKRGLKHNHDFYEKIKFFRQINVFTEEITKEMIWRKFLTVITFYSTFAYSGTHNCF